MLYNTQKKQVKQIMDCLTCPYFDKMKKKCVGGIGKVCFEYDPKTKIVIDPITHLPLRLQ